MLGCGDNLPEITTCNSHMTACRENLIELRVYYDTLTVGEVEQQPEMTVSGILGT